MNKQHLDVIEAYLCKGWSHRKIQEFILRQPSPARGGGFQAMSVLHGFGITGKHKGLLKGKGLDRELFSEKRSIKGYLSAVNETIQKEEGFEKREYIDNPSEFKIVVKNSRISIENSKYITHDDFVKIKGYADICVKVAKDINGESLDYSIDSCSTVEFIIANSTWSKENMETMIMVFGCYVGEVLRFNLGGTWKHSDDYGFFLEGVGPNVLTVFPFSKIKKRFINGIEDNIYYYSKWVSGEV